MIQFNECSFRYKGGRRNALDGITLNIGEGEFVGVTGASGAGKSTLTYAVSGLIPHHFTGDFYGSVTVNGLDTVEVKPEEIARFVGEVFQDIDSQMVSSIVEDEILFGMENFGLPHDEIGRRLEDTLSLLGIEDLRRRQISSLSGGQKQKVAIAAILALQPDVILLDEPTGELDPECDDLRAVKGLKPGLRQDGRRRRAEDHAAVQLCKPDHPDGKRPRRFRRPHRRGRRKGRPLPGTGDQHPPGHRIGGKPPGDGAL